MKAAGIVIGALVAILALSWVFTGNDFFLYKYFAPKQEAVRRQVYEQTKSYHQGSVQRLGTLCMQVDATDDAHKDLINDVIASEFAEWDAVDVPAHLRGCLKAARGR